MFRFYMYKVGGEGEEKGRKRDGLLACGVVCVL